MRRILLLLITLGFTNAFAQRQNVYFLKNNGYKVAQRDSADFIRVVREPDSGSVLYPVMEYYLNGKPKRLGKSSTIDPVRLEGSCVNYNKNGIRESVFNYYKGRFANEQVYFYPNGKVREVRVYPALKDDNLSPNSYNDYRLTTFNDSTGVALVTNGNGHYQYYSSATKFGTEGDVKDGLRNGSWKSSINNDSLQVTEIYDNGKFTSGTGKFKGGEVYTYTKANALPEFEGGVRGFNKFISSKIKYPYQAVQQRVQGSVTVAFVIEPDGTLSNIREAGTSPDAALSAEALRVIRLSPKWTPGLQWGRPKRAEYTIPVVFSLP